MIKAMIKTMIATCLINGIYGQDIQLPEFDIDLNSTETLPASVNPKVVLPSVKTGRYSAPIGVLLTIFRYTDSAPATVTPEAIRDRLFLGSIGKNNGINPRLEMASSGRVWLRGKKHPLALPMSKLLPCHPRSHTIYWHPVSRLQSGKYKLHMFIPDDPRCANEGIGYGKTFSGMNAVYIGTTQSSNSVYRALLGVGKYLVMNEAGQCTQMLGSNGVLQVPSDGFTCANGYAARGDPFDIMGSVSGNQDTDDNKLWSFTAAFRGKCMALSNKRLKNRIPIRSSSRTCGSTARLPKFPDLYAGQ